jgi:hypothetical protein
MSSKPKWRNWQTRRTQNPVGREARVGSIPTFGTGWARAFGFAVSFPLCALACSPAAATAPA